MEAAEGRTAHNGWNGANGMASNHVFNVYDTIPLIPLQPFPQARPPQLSCHQPPVLEAYHEPLGVMVRMVRLTRIQIQVTVVLPHNCVRNGITLPRLHQASHIGMGARDI